MGRENPLKMGGRCPQCQGRLVYDPALRELVCTSCGQVMVFEERLISEKYIRYGRIGTPSQPKVLYAPKESGYDRKAGKNHRKTTKKK